ncbi:MAG: N-acetylmuramoyl-L-alanine amidase [Alphaproteobacteria bacterium]|nr:N-acetylmuramoyl-L-alanine amidase [Alphaproteobacteria bacterium]
MSADAAGTTRFVADLSGKTDVKVFRLFKPSRLVVDFKDSAFARAAAEAPCPAAGVIQGWRTGAPDKKTARIVLDLAAEGSITERHFLLPAQNGAPWRFVMDIATREGVLDPAPRGIVPVPKAPPAGLRPFQVRKTIVLDPGHGGQDPGAISRSGKYEKHITLKMALETKKLLEKAGYKVVLTRSKDTFVPLRERIRRAFEAKADLFVSLHADSTSNRSARGLSVYTISERASDQEAAELAERENKADILFGVDLGEYHPDVGNILLDLSKKQAMDQSAQYAKHLVREMRKEVALIPNAHRFAGFVVLKSPSIPSVLVELGYLSNAREDKLLQKQSYRHELGKALLRATDAYFKETGY